jgi:hypothetical protein
MFRVVVNSALRLRTLWRRHVVARDDPQAANNDAAFVVRSPPQPRIANKRSHLVISQRRICLKSPFVSDRRSTSPPCARRGSVAAILHVELIDTPAFSRPAFHPQT